jgi:hypothetical protein
MDACRPVNRFVFNTELRSIQIDLKWVGFSVRPLTNVTFAGTNAAGVICRSKLPLRTIRCGAVSMNAHRSPPGSPILNRGDAAACDLRRGGGSLYCPQMAAPNSPGVLAQCRKRSRRPTSKVAIEPQERVADLPSSFTSVCGERKAFSKRRLLACGYRTWITVQGTRGASTVRCLSSSTSAMSVLKVLRQSRRCQVAGPAT